MESRDCDECAECGERYVVSVVNGEWWVWWVYCVCSVICGECGLLCVYYPNLCWYCVGIVCVLLGVTMWFIVWVLCGYCINIVWLLCGYCVCYNSWTALCLHRSCWQSSQWRQSEHCTRTALAAYLQYVALCLVSGINYFYTIGVFNPMTPIMTSEET